MKKTRNQHLIVVGGAVVIYLSSWAYSFRSVSFYEIHRKITNTGISNSTLLGGGHFLGPKTRERIHKENDKSDKGAAFNDPARHFDNEQFQQGAQKLAENLNFTIDSLNICDKDVALEKLGHALHALQDFYSHSTWVENNITGPDVLPGDVPFFSNLVTLNAAGVFAAGPLAADPSFTKMCAPSPGPPVSTETSGYYPDDTAPPGKCSHTEINKDYTNASGAYSNPRGASLVNGHSLHSFAFGTAHQHTTSIFEDLHQAMISRFGPADGEGLWNFLIRDNRKLAFVIDTSRSMRDELPLVKSAIINKLNEFETAEEAPILSLFVFKDTWTFIITKCSPTEFIPYINAITASGGGACPDASLGTVQQAITKVGEGGSVVVYTDSSPLEGGTFKQSVIKLAKKSKVKVSFIQVGDCTEPLEQKSLPDELQSERRAAGAEVPGDGWQIYQDIATQSGGVYSWGAGAINEATTLILDNTEVSLADVLYVEREVAAGQEHLLNVPVDHSIESMDFVFQKLDGSGGLLEVYRPDGTVVHTWDPDVDYISTGSLQRVRIAAPVAGAWTMKIIWAATNVLYVASAVGESDTVMLDPYFFQTYDSPGLPEPGESSLSGPALGEPSFIQIPISEEFPEDAAFEFVGLDGAVLEVLPPPQADLEAGLFQIEYAGSDLPGNFLIRATGVDSQGAAFQRISRVVLEASCGTNEAAKLTAPDAAAGEDYGQSVDVNGEVMVVYAIGGANARGYVYRSEGGAWNYEATLLGSDGPTLGGFNGQEASVSCDVAVIGSRYDDGEEADTGAAYAYRYVGGEWVLEQRLLASDGASGDEFGLSVAVDDDLIVVGAPNEDGAFTTSSGAAYVYRFNGQQWVQEQKLLALPAQNNEQFGNSVAMDGGIIAVGSPFDDGDSGAVYVYAHNGLQWVLQQKLTVSATLAYLGFSLSIAGDVILAGAPADADACPGTPNCSSGAAYVFRFDGDIWAEEAKLVAADAEFQDLFGESVAIDGDFAVAGARYEDHAGEYAGAAYLYHFNAGGDWAHSAKLTASDAQASDVFGNSVSISSGTVVVGALGDDDAGSSAGSVYVFQHVSDCDENGRIDICDLVAGSGEDADMDGLLDKCECAGDLNNNLVVNAADLAIILGAWGPNPGHPADYTGNGIVNAQDLAIVLGNWGPCP